MDMDRERWERVGELFHVALEVEAGARDVLLDDACRGDPALRGHVEALLRAHEVSVPMLDGGPELLLGLLNDDASAPRPVIP